MAHLVSTEEELKDAATAKTSVRTAAGATKLWRFSGQFATGVLVANYLNATPAQGAGEAMVTGSISGPFDVWIYL